MSLLVVGTVAFDAIETPFGKTDKIVGGAASYISLAAGYYTKNIHLVSVIGDDFDHDFLTTLKNHGVDLQGLQVKKGEKSFFWAGKYHNDLNSRDTLDTQLNVLEHFNPYDDILLILLFFINCKNAFFGIISNGCHSNISMH